MIYLSVIVPVRNEAEHIADALDRLLAQKYETGKLEILVVDGMSEDATPQIVQEYAQKYPHIRYFENPKRLSSAARNVGIQHAKGEAILIVDGHCFTDNDNMLQRVDEAFAQSGADCLGRPIVMHEQKDAPLLQWAIATARKSPLGHHPDSLMYSHQAQFSPASSVAVAYRMSVFEKVGTFDENFDACEDVEMNTRIDAAGLTCYFEPALAIRYEPRKTLQGLAYQMNRYGRGRVRVFRKHRHTLSWASFGLGAFLFCLIAGLILLCSSYFGLVCAGLDKEFTLWTVLWWLMLGCYFWCLIVPYTVAILGESLRLAIMQKNYIMLPYLPMVFLTTHFGYGWGILREFFFPKRGSKS